jgi:hypothetical protein
MPWSIGTALAALAWMIVGIVIQIVERAQEGFAIANPDEQRVRLMTLLPGKLLLLALGLLLFWAIIQGKTWAWKASVMGTALALTLFFIGFITAAIRADTEGSATRLGLAVIDRAPHLIFLGALCWRSARRYFRRYP